MNEIGTVCFYYDRKGESINYLGMIKHIRINIDGQDAGRTGHLDNGRIVNDEQAMKHMVADNFLDAMKEKCRNMWYLNVART